jgi:endogenous inhibitor of DNA gyrase (YacG/DUF329 family)
MKPRKHMKLVGLAPLVGIAGFFVSVCVLALTEAPIWKFGAAAGLALVVIVGSWAAVRWLVTADCPQCGGPIKLLKEKQKFVYRCSRCSTVVDSGVTVSEMYGRVDA